jgi:hypothetical protein
VTLDLAIRLTGALLGLALAQASAEHLATAPARDRPLFAARLALSVALVAGTAPAWVCLGLLAIGVALLHRFDGPYNGGADRMALLVLVCVTAALWAPDPRWAELALGYLAAQLTVCYVMAGWVKVMNPEWRTGRALRDVFLFSIYPVAESLRRLADRPRRMAAASWAVMGFELLFPLGLLDSRLLAGFLAVAAAFHLANAALFGLNRFVWAWAAAWPSLLWLQQRLAG